MPRSPTLCRLALIAFVLAGCSAEQDPDTDEPPFRFQPPVVERRAANGLELVVLPNHTAPVVTALVAFRAGSFVEDERINGASHLFEHMIFQGSAAVPDAGEFRNQLRALGVSTNATTNVDRVTYYFDAARESLDMALELFAGALREPLLDEAVLDKERQVVLAEFDRNESRTDFAPRKAAMQALFGDYVTRLDPLGSRASVERVTRDELLALHAKYYVPNNALLVLSGDVTLEQGEALAQRHFGNWARSPDPLVEPPPAPPLLDHGRMIVMESASSFLTFDVWWRGPSTGDYAQEVLAGELLALVTGNPTHSFRQLIGLDLGQAVSLSVASFRSSGYVHAQVVARPGNEWAVRTALDLSLRQLGEPGDVLMKQLKTERAEDFRSFLLRSVEPAAAPHDLAYDWGRRDTQAYFDYVDELYALVPVQVERFAQIYLHDRPKVTVISGSAEQLLKAGYGAPREVDEWAR